MLHRKPALNRRTCTVYCVFERTCTVYCVFEGNFVVMRGGLLLRECKSFCCRWLHQASACRNWYLKMASSTNSYYCISSGRTYESIYMAGRMSGSGIGWQEFGVFGTNKCRKDLGSGNPVAEKNSGNREEGASYFAVHLRCEREDGFFAKDAERVRYSCGWLYGSYAS